MTPTLEPFPTDWRTALVLVPHPDDPEYGIGAAVAAWTAAGRTVRYALATRGERGIEGMAPEEAGPLREGEQRRSAAIVGVDDVEFWDFPDGSVRDTPALHDRIATAIAEAAPDVVVTIYSGDEWAPGEPNQTDHIEFAKAVAKAYDTLADPPRWLFENGSGATHGQPVDGHIEAAVASLAAHEVYLRVLDPDTPVIDQARTQVAQTTQPHPSFGGRPTVQFIQRRP
ncbi:LmbE family N-acetylglucosaminyl deacetylase [Mycolicibacterium iranicum]|uniref:LmbE family N-acetylglucosaminyl deacetylase n=1 Tax=Mycolicibacterium iranicum TaxID=912594 RepID=A0A839QD82_MYCIR|nr:PIG-L family deacetylase [Mycolicibacterium iranicum]MBB2993567.1 LmbE family N-acetylglucosaminyl deacetylase [Mycolicibacterium iranicum]